MPRGIGQVGSRIAFLFSRSFGRSCVMLRMIVGLCVAQLVAVSLLGLGLCSSDGHALSSSELATLAGGTVPDACDDSCSNCNETTSPCPEGNCAGRLPGETCQAIIQAKIAQNPELCGREVGGEYCGDPTQQTNIDCYKHHTCVCNRIFGEMFCRPKVYSCYHTIGVTDWQSCFARAEWGSDPAGYSPCN